MTRPRRRSIAVAVSGAAGRMGRRIGTLLLERPGFRIVGAVEAEGSPALGQDVGQCWGGGPPLGVVIVADPRQALHGADVLIEFTTPAATMRHLQAALAERCAMVIGTTGLSASEHRRLTRAGRSIPILHAPNMSQGVNLLFELAELAARRLGAVAQFAIQETHHAAKRDAPSGTALRLVEVVAGAALKPAGTIPVHAFRLGDVVGEHTLILAMDGERLELTHRASSRDIFAQGAIQAAAYVAGRRAGFYTMQDVLESMSKSSPQ